MKSRPFRFIAAFAAVAYTAALVSCSDSKDDGNQPYKTVTVGEQNGVIHAGAPGVATFVVTTENIADGKTGTVTWYYPETGTITATPPAGVTPSVTAVSNNKATVTMTVTGAEPGGYYFTVTIDGTGSTTSIYLAVTSKRVMMPAQDFAVWRGEDLRISVWVDYIEEGKTGEVQWYTSAEGMTSCSAPAGVSGSVSAVANQIANITIDATEAVSTGTYWFRVTIDGVTSAAATLDVTQMTILTTVGVTDINTTGATVGGNIIDEGTPPYTERGLYYSIWPNPVYDNKIVSPGSGTGPFSETLTALTPGTKYYVMAYALQTNRTVYGNVINFNTPASLSATSLNTDETTAITSTGATLNGNIYAVGNPAYTERGFCYATWPQPTTVHNKVTVAGTETGGFSAVVTGLTAYQIYYVRAYAIQGGETVYGGETGFYTLASMPVISTSAPANITATSATVGGVIHDTGKPAYIDRGVCYSTSPNPGFYDSKISSPEVATGPFSIQMTGLPNLGLTWYVRAYAIGHYGVVLGDQVSFTTSGTTTIPAAPAGLTATAASSSQINLSWNASTGATGYKVERSANGTSGWTEIAPSVTATSYQNSGLSAGTTYYYRVRAYNGAGNSGYSNTANATTQTPSLVAPALSLVGSQPVSGLFTLRCSYTWPGLGATTDRYELEISENGGSTYSLLLTGADGDRTSPFSFNLETESGDAGKTFYFRARVRTSSEYTPYSTPISVSIAAVPPPIAVKYTRSNALEYYSLDASAANTSYPNQPPSVGNMYMNNVAGYNAGLFAHALYFNVNAQISGKNIKKAELRMYTQSATMEPGVFYTIETIASSWTAAATYNHMLNWNFYSSATKTKAAPTSYLSLWAVDVTTSVRNWANGTWSNNGFLLHDTGSYHGYNAYRTSTFIGIENSNWDTVLYIEFQ